MMDKFKLDNKNIIITGGAGFLGRMHAEAIAQAGGHPILGDLYVEEAQEIAAQISTTFHVRACGIQLDVTKKESISEMLQTVLNEYGQVDALINNAANDPKVKETSDGLEHSRFENFSLEQWNNDIEVGLTGSFLCSQIIGREMEKKGKGVILNISSDLGLNAPDQRIYRKEGCPEHLQPVKPVSYSVVKHALIGLTKYLATYWADKGIRVNTLCPGGVYNNQPDAFVTKLTHLIPMGRMANKDEYMAAVLFLLSDASSYMTGSTLVIDGGRHCW
ncbi:MAG: SDR family oxidoreductase [Candidatus Omnitrophica bacterium]|nr:SDR family oxidoreductase [Candidatus Omnitrophota bacterium]